MAENQKIWKMTPLIVGAVLLAMITVFGFVADIPFAMKYEIDNRLKSVQIRIDELKEVDKTLWALKEQDNDWYREVAQEVAIAQKDIKYIRDGQAEIKSKLEKIEQLLRER